MATLLLTAVGTAVLGPIGGAVGAILGQQADRALFGPKGREGPRLNDLSVQTSAYGTPLPRLFGTMRIAGTVVWATELREDRNREGGGKGRPSTTTYSYSASFAVALSARPIRAVHRIWADGKLLRGAAGDFKSETGFRLLTGGEGQAADPLIVAAEAGGGTPAYRGLALAVFEDFQLADYGNRIPSLTFEVEADEGPVPLDRIVRDLSGGAAEAESATTLTGYAGHGDSARGAVETLLAAMPHHVRDDGERLRIVETAPAATILDAAALGAKPGERGGDRSAGERQRPDAAADEVAVRYYEPARDYQAGLQRARRGGPGRRAERIDLPACLAADRAKAIAEARLERGWAERAAATVALPWRAMALRPGDAVRIPGRTGEWRIAGFALEKMAVRLDLARIGPGPAAVANAAAPGRSVSDPDLVHGPTVVHLLDLPEIGDGLDAAPRLLIAAAGPSPGWRKAALAISLDDGASYEAIGQTAPPAVLGEAVTALPSGGSALFDAAAWVEVQLLGEAMWLAGASDDALVAGANLALLGDELFQFGVAEALGAGRFRQSRMLRGRRGSEWAAGDHAAGERFVLLDPATLRGIDAPVAALGATVRLLAAGVGDTEGAAEAETQLYGRSVRPPAPVHVRAERLVDGAIAFAWTRRSRLGWAWTDGGDAPFGEEAERWRVTVTPDAGAMRTVEVASAAWTYGAAEQIADGAGAASSFTIAIVQIGALAASEPPATRSFEL